MANDANASGTAVTIPTVVFYPTKADAENDTNGFTVATNFANAQLRPGRGRRAPRQLCADPDRRRVHFRRHVSAEAVASLGSAICKVPPVMMCNPAEPASNTNIDYAFDANSPRRRGPQADLGRQWQHAPGLRATSAISIPARRRPTANVELREALGWATAPGDCSALNGVRHAPGGHAGDPGAQHAVRHLRQAEHRQRQCGLLPNGGSCPPSINTVKDVLRKRQCRRRQQVRLCQQRMGGCRLTSICRPDDGGPATRRQAMPRRDGLSARQVPRRFRSTVRARCAAGKIGDGAWDRERLFPRELRLERTQWPGYINSGINPISTRNSHALPGLSCGKSPIAERRSAARPSSAIARSAATSPARPVHMASRFVQPLQSPAPTESCRAAANVGPAANFRGGDQLPRLRCPWRRRHRLSRCQMDRVLPRRAVAHSGPNTDANDIYVEIIGETDAGAGVERRHRSFGATCRI